MNPLVLPDATGARHTIGRPHTSPRLASSATRSTPPVESEYLRRRAFISVAREDREVASRCSLLPRIAGKNRQQGLLKNLTGKRRFARSSTIPPGATRHSRQRRNRSRLSPGRRGGARPWRIRLHWGQSGTTVTRGRAILDDIGRILSHTPVRNNPRRSAATRRAGKRCATVEEARTARRIGVPDKPAGGPPGNERCSN